MKNFFAMLLTMLLTFGFSACGSSESAEDTKDTAKQEEVAPEEDLSPWIQTKTGQFYSQFKDGKMYMEYETTVEDSTTTLCFDGDKLAYMIGGFEGEEMIMKILSFSADVDDSLFELPEGYQMMSF